MTVLLIAVLALSCVKEQSLDSDGNLVDIALHFGAPANTIVEPTKGTMGVEAESRIYNIYVFIFDSTGKKFYGHFFDHSNRSTSGGSTLSDWWELDNGAVTSGTLHIHTAKSAGCTLVAIANIDAEMVNISPEQLGMVNTYADIYDQKAQLNQLIVSRSGYFPMTGEMKSVDFSSSSEAIPGKLILRRLDAKIMFNVHVNPESAIASFTPLTWQVVNLPKRAYVLQRGDYYEGLLTEAQQNALKDAATTEDAFFNLPEMNFETETITEDTYSGSTQNKILIHGFSFYMMENRKKPINTPDGGWSDYKYREECDKTIKDASATAARVENGDFKYADPFSTYVIIKGRVVMDNISFGEVKEGATLSADVQYIIHLGDFSGGKYGDFNVFRNHTYKYDVLISGVTDIRTEVEVNHDDDDGNNYDENAPGATGNVSVALEEVFTSDAHYCSHVINFHAKYIDPEKVTWTVQTPFNPSGAEPVLLPDGTENTAGIDYEWVEFRLNKKDAQGNYYDDHRQNYYPHDGKEHEGVKTMNISELVAYLKEETRKYKDGQPCAFDNDTELVKDEQGNDQLVPNPKISVTAFVNEYYYETNPITGDYQRDLWKRFVNQPMRYIHILSETKSSADRESQIIGASFTIQQRSIQSIYNISNPDLHSAWGCEHFQDQLEAGTGLYNVNKNNEDRGNTDLTNGRLNTMKEWGVLKKNGTSYMGDRTIEEAWWDHYLDLEADNETPLMLPNYQYLRYSCMSRNRDNNGNGVIDEDEVRWYMAASNQLIGLFLGGYGIEGSARLYQRTAQERASNERNVWRQHVIASTRYPGRSNSNNNARVIWAEEGITGSDISYYSAADGSTDTYSTRCVRNLGSYQKDNGEYEDITFAPRTVEPDNYIKVIRMRNGVEYPEASSNPFDNYVYYIFDCSRLNTASLRFYTNRELSAHDENDEAACLYKKFEVASRAESETKPLPGKIGNYSVKYVNQLNAYLDDPNNIEANPFCPSGYRLCNVREDAVIWSFVPTNELGSFLPSGVLNHSRTHWSFGASGKDNKNLPNKSWGWTINSTKIIMGNVDKNDQQTTSLRCVRDIKVE